MDGPVDYGHLAQKAAEAHLAACDDALYDYDEHGDDATVQMPETAGPYCGCSTCIVRETLHAAWPIIEQYVRANPEARYGDAEEAEAAEADG